MMRVLRLFLFVWVTQVALDQCKAFSMPRVWPSYYNQMLFSFRNAGYPGFCLQKRLNWKDTQANHCNELNYFEVSPPFELIGISKVTGNAIIHTESVNAERAIQVKVALAMEGSIKSDYVHVEKEKILNVPLLQVQIFRFNSESGLLMPVGTPQVFSIKGLYQHFKGHNDFDLDHPLDFAFDGFLESQSYTIEKGWRWSVRVDLVEPKILGFSKLKVLLGDQIGILEVGDLDADYQTDINRFESDDEG